MQMGILKIASVLGQQLFLWLTGVFKGNRAGRDSCNGRVIETDPGGVWVVVCCSVKQMLGQLLVKLESGCLWAHMVSCVRSRSDWLIS